MYFCRALIITWFGSLFKFQNIPLRPIQVNHLPLGLSHAISSPSISSAFLYFPSYHLIITPSSPQLFSKHWCVYFRIIAILCLTSDTSFARSQWFSTTPSKSPNGNACVDIRYVNVSDVCLSFTFGCSNCTRRPASTTWIDDDSDGVES